MKFAGSRLVNLYLVVAFQHDPAMKMSPHHLKSVACEQSPQSRRVRLRRRRTPFACRLGVMLAAAVALAIPSLRATDNGKWIGTWAASPQPVWEADFLAPINFPRNLWN